MKGVGGAVGGRLGSCRRGWVSGACCREGLGREVGSCGGGTHWQGGGKLWRLAHDGGWESHVKSHWQESWAGGWEAAGVACIARGGKQWGERGRVEIHRGGICQREIGKSWGWHASARGLGRKVGSHGAVHIGRGG